MTFSNYPADCKATLVLDTSVLINLHASTCGERILSVLPYDIVVSEIVAKELENETSMTKGSYGFLHSLVDSGKVCISTMMKVEFELFLQLVTASSSLDDGEAATITIATVRNFLPVIDERRGCLKAGELISHKRPSWSFDILRHPSVLECLSDDDAINALYLALYDGRMRIPEERCDEVINLIGIDKAAECTCLPNYKLRIKTGFKK